VFVNGHIDTRRGRKLRHGDVVTVEGEEITVLVEKDGEGEHDETGKTQDA